jgi:ketosteroid isomerase-like protein
MNEIAARDFAAEWIAAWNSRDLNRVLNHYRSDIVLLSPVAQKIVGNGRIVGIEALRKYWEKALAEIPNLHFEFEDLRVGHECLTILYRNHRGQNAAETFELSNGKVVRSFACYG